MLLPKVGINDKREVDCHRSRRVCSSFGSLHCFNFIPLVLLVISLQSCCTYTLSSIDLLLLNSSEVRRDTKDLRVES